METTELSISNGFAEAMTTMDSGETKDVTSNNKGTVQSQEVILEPRKGTTEESTSMVNDSDIHSGVTSMVTKRVRFNIDESRIVEKSSKRSAKEVQPTSDKQGETKKQSNQTTIFGSRILENRNGPSRVQGERSDTFLESLQSLSEQERSDTLEKIRDRFMELMEPTFTRGVIHLPVLTYFLSEEVYGALDVLLSNFRSFYFRVSVNAPSTGHHPVFNRDGMTRTGQLDPTSFAIVPTFQYIELLSGRFKVHLKNEILQNKNIRLRNFLAFRVNEKLSYISVEGGSSTVVRQNGLTLLEASLFYFICSRRRLLLEDIKILQKAFPYFTFEEDIYRILNEMTMFISENVHIDDVLQSFMNGYVRILYNIMFSPLTKDLAYLQMDVIQDNLLTHWNSK